MIFTGAPTKLKNDNACPFFYLSQSWTSQQRIPWHEKRHMRPGAQVGESVWVKTNLTNTHTTSELICSFHLIFAITHLLF